MAITLLSDNTNAQQLVVKNMATSGLSMFMSQFAPGHLILVSVAILSATITSTLTVTTPMSTETTATITLIRRQQNATSGVTIEVWAVQNAPLTFTLQVTPSATVTVAVMASEWSGAEHVGTIFEPTMAGATNATATMTSGTVTASATADLLLAGWGWIGIQAPSALTSFWSTTYGGTVSTAYVGTTGAGATSNVNTAMAYNNAGASIGSNTGATLTKGTDTRGWAGEIVGILAATYSAPSWSVTPTTTSLSWYGASFSWTAPSGTIQYYRMERAAAGSGVWSLLSYLTTSVTSYADSSATPSTSYDYRIVAVNPANSGTSATVTVTTPDFVLGQDLETGSNTTAITVGNSQGVQGIADPWSAVLYSNVTYSSTQAKNGSLSARFQNATLAVGGQIGGLQWTFPQPSAYNDVYLRFYIYIPTGGLGATNSGYDFAMWNTLSGGRIKVIDSGGTSYSFQQLNFDSSANGYFSVNYDTWNRVECHISYPATTSIEWRLFNGDGLTNPGSSPTVSGGVLPASPLSLFLTNNNAGTQNVTMYLDAFAAGHTGWIGPYVPTGFTGWGIPL